MALCHPSLQDGQGKLTLTDAENAWFVRVNHIEHYGTDVHLERLTAEPPVPLLFLNIDAAPMSRALIWEHIEDAPAKRCPNPRVIIPRRVFPSVVEGAVSVDIRSFGVRTPPMHKGEAKLRHPWPASHSAAGAGVALAAGLAARTRQSQHRRQRGHDQ